MSKEGRFSIQELHQYRDRLVKQKEFLSDILSKIEKQILALQVERLHLRNTLLGTECVNEESLNTLAINNSVNTESVPSNPQSQMEQKLDLSVPEPLHDFEVEDDESSDNEKILKELDFL